jgi:hypothetical protein
MSECADCEVEKGLYGCESCFDALCDAADSLAKQRRQLQAENKRLKAECAKYIATLGLIAVGWIKDGDSPCHEMSRREMQNLASKAVGLDTEKQQEEVEK